MAQCGPKPPSLSLAEAVSACQEYRSGPALDQFEHQVLVVELQKYGRWSQSDAEPGLKA